MVDMMDIYDLMPIPTCHRPQVCSSGILGLDLLLGGGWLKGRLAEISGIEQSGKSTLAWYALAAAQQRGEIAAVVSGSDREVTDWLLHLCGVRLDQLVVAVDNECDDTIAMACDLLSTGGIGVLVIDNLQRSTVVSGKARITKTRAAALADATIQSGTTTVMIVDTTMHWLEAHPFWIGQHVHTTYHGKDLLNVHAVRTPIGYVKQDIKIPVRDFGGVNEELHLLRLAVQLHYVEDKNGHYTFRGQYLGHGAARAALLVKEDETLQCALRAAVTSRDAALVLFAT